jgi:hypothetical protein
LASESTVEMNTGRWHRVSKNYSSYLTVSLCGTHYLH